MSWAQLIGIKAEAREIKAADKAKPIVECPLCGEVLDELNGVVSCPWGHFRQVGRVRHADSV